MERSELLVPDSSRPRDHRDPLERSPLLRPYATKASTTVIAPRDRGISPSNVDSPQAGIIRCAIYTRKSTEEGLDRDINSLSVQRQACEDYIRSRASDGWTLAAEQYDDGGWSGATIKRPAFQRLLADVEAKRIDCVIVHRVDRLSRSLLDFARLMHYFQERGVAFISVSQNFSTADPVGRLTLNLLATFAEFEREMISARTKSTVHAARRRGRWTGGFIPLGYDLQDGHLVVNEAEAHQVRALFEIYMETSSLTCTVEEVTRRGLTMKTGAHQNGSPRSGRPFDKPSLLRVLRNPIYAGLTRCNGGLAHGEHDAIIAKETWQRVQGRLTRNGSAGYQGEHENSDALLKGLLRCGACGSRMSPTYTVKSNRRYHYYICQSVAKKGARTCPRGRVAANKIEQQVIEHIRTIARDPLLVSETVRQVKAQLEAKVKALESESKSLRKELQYAKASLTRLVRRRNGQAGGLADQIASVDQRIRAAEQRLSEVERDCTAAKQQEIDEGAVAALLTRFEPLWDALWPAERSRILGLLLEGIVYDGRDGSLAVKLRPDGIGALNDDQPA